MYKKDIEFSSVKEFLSTEVGIDDVDLKAATDYDGQIIDLSGYKELSLILLQTVIGDTSTLGKIDIVINGFLDDGTTYAIPYVQIIRDLSLILPAGANFEFAIGINLETGVIGYAKNNWISLTGMTVASDITLGSLQVLGKVQFVLSVTEASDAGTSHVASMTVRASP